MKTTNFDRYLSKQMKDPFFAARFKQDSPATTKHPTPRKAAKAPAFVLRAERALRRAAKNVQAQSRALKIPVVVWQNGKVVEKAA